MPPDSIPEAAARASDVDSATQMNLLRVANLHVMAYDGLNHTEPSVGCVRTVLSASTATDSMYSQSQGVFPVSRISKES